jgi:hypothetical protein
MPYGIRGELIPNARSVATMKALLVADDVEVKLPADITDEDSAQRGPDGKPLVRVTPLVPYQTMEEWRR